MRPTEFDYFAPGTLDEAIGLLKKYNGEAKVLAGGQSLLPLLKSRVTSIPYLVDIANIESLTYITRNDKALLVGSTTKVSALENYNNFGKNFEIIKEATASIADPLIRNMGTVGGNIAHGDPGNDLPAVLMALDGSVTVTGPGGQRHISARELYLDSYTTSIKDNEIITEVQFPFWGTHSSGTYIKFKKPAGDFSIAAIAIQLKVNKDGICERFGAALASVGPTSIFLRKASEVMVGSKITPTAMKKAAETAVKEINPVADRNGTVDQKRELVRRMFIEGTRKSLRKL
ncbi:FAD binding domain-containing protein [Oxyplasma meridianum]|uniref:FAD binding domain-containing protein n=1 Tax=Oxyplasma meridianum TaxID=3073602 RepID=A0AAX4NGT9_9ARCH